MMVEFFILSVLAAAVCAILDFVVDQFCDGYRNVLKRPRAFLVFLAKEIRKEIFFACGILMVSFLAGFGLSMGVAAFYLLSQ